jgi:hypothetical protein
LAAVHAAQGGDVISDVEGEEITYLGNDGRPRTIRSANLRARFYRAKKKVNAEVGECRVAETG